jgi:hypothetical protein
MTGDREVVVALEHQVAIGRSAATQNVTTAPVDGDAFVVKSIHTALDEIRKRGRPGDTVQNGDIFHAWSLSLLAKGMGDIHGSPSGWTESTHACLARADA